MENESTPVHDSAKDRRITKIIFSIASVLCCLVFGSVFLSFYYLNSVIKEQRVSATSDAATAQVHATSTSIRHATQVAGYEIFDDFDANFHDWDVEVEDNEWWNGTIAIRDGIYIWDVEEVKNPGVLSWRDFDDQKIVRDFDLSIDAKLAKGTSDLLCYAIAFRASPRSFRAGAYIFSVCDSGVYEVQYYNRDSKSESIRSWEPSQAIRPGDWNTLSVRAREDQIVLSINNVVVSEFTDTRRIGGYIYLVIRIFDDQPGTIYFDNFGLQSYLK